ncbi:gamma-glutamyltransferase [Paraferrimonas sedimenticola]|uniref:Glutathione hydrolase proenzyme n=1 Tax=Paraferrimonas sedimenticola TaxID=375674 RepID=A0AA37RY78_9GAMM|nr:gamma-glutamyltransferase [Paraferrimonas sedimenticola]GLP97358.1 gamma-glutamyltransferase [Paraferrimonas sedimenticola]
MRLIIALIGFISFSVSAFDRVTGHEFASRSEVYGTNGMVATSQPLATQIGLDVLKEGGSALDAAIAANAALGLMEPTGCGIGGDLFAIVWSAKDKKLYGYNGSGRSPLSLTLKDFQDKGLTSIPAHGPLPVSVPGTVDAWFALHDKFGELPMSRLLQPAIDYAEAGFPVSELISYYLNRSAPKLSKFPNFSETFMPNGRMPATGEIFKNPDLANSYRLIARDGRDAFYKGDIAKAIDSYMKDNDGYLNYKDLESHKGEWVEPVPADYRGVTLWELPPNGQGIAAQQILKILEGYDIASMDRFGVEFAHLFIEAKKLAFEDRAKFYADPDFHDIPVMELVSAKYADERRKLIDPNKAMKAVEAGNPALLHGDTIYLTTADKDGNMVSLIQSNYRGMGSGMTPTGTGFVLQDRGEMFNLEPGHLNSYAPGKRPFHTIIPAFITKDGKPWISYGVMGGATQPQMHAQVLINMVDFGMNLQEAGDAPRILHTGSSQPTGEKMTDGGVVSLESGYSWEFRRGLMEKGHVLKDAVGPYGGYQAIRRDDNGAYAGASESRKDGQAAGY